MPIQFLAFIDVFNCSLLVGTDMARIKKILHLRSEDRYNLYRFDIKALSKTPYFYFVQLLGRKAKMLLRERLNYYLSWFK